MISDCWGEMLVSGLQNTHLKFPGRAACVDRTFYFVMSFHIVLLFFWDECVLSFGGRQAGQEYSLLSEDIEIQRG